MALRILATSDIHGMVFSEKYATREKMNLGFLKTLATMKKYETGNLLKIDNGDILEGSPFLERYYHFHRQEMHPMASLMRKAGYDFVNIGNHDLNYGPHVLRQYLKDCETPCITGNLFYQGNCFGKEYTLTNTQEGHKIAIVGALTHYIRNWEKSENMVGIEVEDAFDFTRRVVDKIRKEEKVDGIVVVYHGGFERDLETGELHQTDSGENQAYRMCKEIEGIDVLITGHQHRSLCGMCHGKFISQTAAQGAEFVVIDWDINNKVITGKLIESSEEIDTDLAREFLTLEEETQLWLDTPLATVVEVDLEVKNEFEARVHKHPIISLINTIQKQASGAMLSGNALFNGAIGFHTQITMRDVLSTYMFPNTLVTFRVNGKFLKEYLEKSAAYFELREGELSVSKEYGWPKPQHYNYDMVDGVDYVIDVNCERGSRITSLIYQGKKVEDDDIFSLVVSNYRASGGGDYLMFKEAEIIKEDSREMTTLITEYLLAHPQLNVEHRQNIRVIY